MCRGSTWSAPRPVTGGGPQGSILGVFLFNLTTDDLEEGTPFVLQAERPEPEEDWNEFYRARPDPISYNPGWAGADALDRAADGQADEPDAEESDVDDSFCSAKSGGDDSFHSAISTLPDDHFSSTPRVGATPMHGPCPYRL